MKYKEIEGTVFDACKTNDKEIWPNLNSGPAHKIHVSWLYYGDIKIRDTFVYKYTPTEEPLKTFCYAG